MQNPMYEELVRTLLSALPGEPVRIVLYGSTARGTAEPDSDVDVAVFLNRPLTPQEQERLSETVADLNLKYDKVFSVVDIDTQTYFAWRDVSPFYQNVDREGIVLWKTA